METQYLAALLVGLVAGLASGYFTAQHAVPNAAKRLEHNISEMLLDAGARQQRVLDEIETWAERGAEHRKRTAMSVARNQIAQPKYASAPEYQRALNAGHPRDPETERRLGWAR